MKKFLFAALAAVTVLFASCDNPEPEPEPTPANAVECGIYGIAWYGDYYQNGTVNYYVQLIQDLDNLDGAYVVFDLCAASKDIVGTYTASSNGTAGTFVIGDANGSGSCIMELAEGSIEGDPVAIEDGTLVISKEGTTYKVVYTSADGSVSYVGTGDVEISNGAYPYESMDPTTFTANFTTVSATYKGNTGYGSDAYILVLDGAYYAMINMFAANGSSATEVPTGTYNGATSQAANTFYPGFFYNSSFYPSVIAVLDDSGYVQQVWYMVGGSFTIGGSTGAYTISGTVTSGCGSQITLNYSGDITITDDSAAAPKMAPRAANVLHVGK
ncbi:MAG: hypothetical protein Q4D14_00290 [Bacteroidales bacterium]|nr:hypothetical protein [Bacteroidales bacterium]